MEALPALAAAAGSAAGDCPPPPACAQDPSYAAAGAAYSVYEDSRKAFMDAPLDVAGMLASPAPVTAAGDLQPPHQAEPQPPASSAPPPQQPQQQQAAEQAKGAALVDPYQYLLALSNFPSPRPGVRGWVGGNGRGDEAGPGDFASAYLNQASAPSAPAGATMMEVCILLLGVFKFLSSLSTHSHTYTHPIHSWPTRRTRRAT